MHRTTQLVLNLIIFLFILVPTTTMAQEQLVYFWQPFTEGDAPPSSTEIRVGNLETGTYEAVANGIYPDINSEGTEVFYVENSAEGMALRVVDLLTKDNTPLTPAEQGIVLSPSVSGTGRYVAYSGPYGLEGKNQVAILDLWDDNPYAHKEVLVNEHPAYFPDLSSEGRFVVYHQTVGTTEFRKGKAKQVIIYDRQTQTKTELTGPDEYCFEPAISFDDRLVAFVCRIENQDGVLNDDIYVVDLFADDFRKKTRVTTNPGKDYAPTFRPNGNIVFSSDRGQRDKEFQLFEAKRGKSGFDIALFLSGEGVHYIPSFSGDLNYALFQAESLVLPRSSFGLASGPSQLYAVGGHHGSQHDRSDEGVTTHCEKFTYATDFTWTPMAERPHRAQGMQAFVHGDFLYAIGGSTPDSEADMDLSSIANIDRCNLVTGTWEPSVAHLITPRSSFGAAQLGSRVYILGGWVLSRDEEDMTHFTHIDEIDLETLEVSRSRFNLPLPLRRGFSATPGPNGKIFLLGGMSDRFSLLTTVHVLDTNATSNEEAWSQLPDLPFGAFAPSSVYANGKLFSFGGVSPHPFAKGRRGASRYTADIYVLDLENTDLGWLHTGHFMKEPKAFARVQPMITDVDNAFAIVGGQSFELGDLVDGKREAEKKDPVATVEVFRIEP